MMVRIKDRGLHLPFSMITGILMLAFFPGAFSQDLGSFQYEETLEKLSERTSGEINPEEISDEPYQGSTVNLNSADVEDLIKLGFLSKKQIDNILAYIRDYGGLLSLNELKGIEGLDSATIAKLENRTRIASLSGGPAITVKNLLHYSRHDLILRYEQGLQEKQGFSTNQYLGSRQKYYFRYAYKFSDRILAGFGGEKDAGEQFLRGCQDRGFDFYTSYIALQNTGFIRSLVAGNFSASFGQGLCLGSGTSMSSVTGTGIPFRVTQGIKPSGSMNESQYLRGIGATLKFWKFDLSLLFSSHKRDATVESEVASDRENRMITSLLYTGYHRTAREIAGKNAVREKVYGGNLAFTGKFYRIGLTFINSSWNLPFKVSSDLYKLHAFRGKTNQDISIDFVMRLKFLTIFGEGSASKSGGTGVIAGIYGDIAQGTTFSLTYRNYSPMYQSQFANPISQNSQASNETGFLLNFNAPLARRINISAYADLFRFPWLKYRVNSASMGFEAAVTMTWQLGANIIQSGRYSYISGMLNNTKPGQVISPVEEISSWGIRYRIEWNVSQRLKIRTFFDLKSSNKNEGEKNIYGYMAGEELHFTWKNHALALI